MPIDLSLIYVDWLVGSKSKSQAESKIMDCKMAPRLAQVEPGRGVFGGSKLAESAVDWDVQAIKCQVDLSSRYVDWLLGSMS